MTNLRFFLRPVAVAATFLTVAAAGANAASPKAEAENALKVLSPRVTRMSDPSALKTAFQAYYNYRAAHPSEVRKPYLFFVDLGLDNTAPRGYVFDMENLRVVEGGFTVAHGRGSSAGRNGVPTKFSNRAGSYASSLGLYVARDTYTFHSSSYTSMGLRLDGESGSFNDAAMSRGVVAHGAPYVTSRDAGRSEGCPAMEPDRARRLLPQLANGGVVFVYSPRDRNWLANDPWINAGQ
jgi:hypothetical protein